MKDRLLWNLYYLLFDTFMVQQIYEIQIHLAFELVIVNTLWQKSFSCHSVCICAMMHLFISY